MLPYVVVYNAVSADGCLDWLKPGVEMFDELLGQYYGKVVTFHEDATMAGAETMLKALEWENVSDDEAGAPFEPVQGDARPLLVIPDSRGRIRIWRWLLSQPYWRAGVALCSATTPTEHMEYLQRTGIESIVAGDDHVDLRVALEELNGRFGVARVRVDSGGTLNGALLHAGLVSEVSLMLLPVLAGGASTISIFRAPALASPDKLIHMKLTHCEQLDGGTLWLRYDVLRRT
ncbi:MAG: RibD family protein [Dehalococcoidia bacterium]|nr:MAG: RibD family protein [Dehalococcoidia bacterium]